MVRLLFRGGVDWVEFGRPLIEEDPTAQPPAAAAPLAIPCRQAQRATGCHRCVQQGRIYVGHTNKDVICHGKG